MTLNNVRLLPWLLAALLVAGCGGGNGSGAASVPDAAAACNPADAATADECGTVLLGFTDADGDFLNYTVDVLGLTLETANGRSVEVLPGRTRINFTDYVELTELVAAAFVPPATYVAGTLRLDFADAEVFVEAGGEAKAATVTDADGNPIGAAAFSIRLADREQLTVTRRRAQLLQLDFDLAASHTVDIVPTPAIAVAEPFILAEVHPVDEKDFRVRGPLVAVDEAAMNYTIAIRPFNHRHGDYGRFTINVTGQTEFEVDEELLLGADGLRALAAAGPGTPTVAGGTLATAERSYTAAAVLAGSSVPGHDRDAVAGNIIARDGNFLTVRGATVIRNDAGPDHPWHFHDDVVVEVGPGTRVFRDWHRARDLGIDALSIGQRVTVRGELVTAATDAATPQLLFDATAGAVRMHVTSLAGIVNTVLPGQADITLQSIDRRRADVFDFTGTGPSPAEDADPANYEVRTFTLTLADLAEGRPIVVRGFPTAFSTAPPDFAGRSVIDYSDVRSALGVGWGSEGTAAPFLSLGTDGLVLDNQNPDIGVRHYIKQGPVLIDLTALDSGTSILPRESGRMIFAIRTSDSLLLYATWSEFADELSNRLGAGSRMRSMHAYGSYDGDSNTLVAVKLGVSLLEP